MKRQTAFRVLIICLFITFVFCLNSFASESPSQSPADKNGQQADTGEAAAEKDKADSSLKMLASIAKLKTGLRDRINEKQAAVKKSVSEAEKESLNFELEKLDKQLNDYNLDFERIATGIDIGLFAEKKVEEFDWKNEIVGLVEPGIKEIKLLTLKARQKTKLKDERSRYENLAPIAKNAVENIERLLSESQDTALKKQLKSLLPEWQAVEKQILNKLEIVNMRLNEMESEEKSFFETSQTSIKNFFRTRGLFLSIAVLSCLAVIFALRVLSRAIIRVVPGYKNKYRPFHVRAMDLFFRVLVVFLTLFVLIAVFYVVEDWVLLSLTIIVLLGIGWAAKETLPQYWNQSRLMLNIGPVREGERLMLDGVPWRVKNINFYSELENPALDIKLRVPIGALLDKTSRPYQKHEPWFPCQLKDWVILSDGTRGVVTSMSHEMVEMVQRGGSHKTYQTGDFLSLSPLNISTNFRLKNTFGIGYGHQAEATGQILDTLKAYITDQVEKEGYGDSLLNLRVEFQTAGASSLDLVVISDFKGEQAPLYQRLNRAVQRWCVDCCTQNGWDIPFPQLTVHKGE